MLRTKSRPVSTFARIPSRALVSRVAGWGSWVGRDTELHPVRMLVGAGRTHTSLLIAGS